MKLNELECKVDFFDFDEKLYQELEASPLKDAFLISYNKEGFKELSLDEEEAKSEDFLAFMNGEKLLNHSKPYSMVYAGYQFGQFVPQLGDGRAINLGSVNNWHLQTKGSGPTLYSRRGDGRAVLRSSIREYIMGEAMHALDIPTTRALGIIGSRHEVPRSYDEVEYGSIVLRMSPSWIRIGTFEFYARNENASKNIPQLCDYVIKQSYPNLEGVNKPYEKMFYSMVDKTAELMAKWQVYGFMHGVMNTDNMSMAGLTIDYGPFAFMDYFDKHCICNHSDVEGRYSYNNQPYVARWNLEVLANALSEVCEVKKLTQYLETFFPQHEKVYLELMCERLGLDTRSVANYHVDLIISLLAALQEAKADYNCFFYELSRCDNLDDISSVLAVCVNPSAILAWFEDYKKVVLSDLREEGVRRSQMKESNPKYIIKNYMLQEAIDAAKSDDFTLVNALLHIAQNPFDEHKEYERYSKVTPMEHANLQLSCSS